MATAMKDKTCVVHIRTRGDTHCWTCGERMRDDNQD